MVHSDKLGFSFPQLEGLLQLALFSSLKFRPLNNMLNRILCNFLNNIKVAQNHSMISTASDILTESNFNVLLKKLFQLDTLKKCSK